MLTTKKDEFIGALRINVLREIPGLDEQDLLGLEKEYLYLNIYKYLINLSVDQARKLTTLRNAALEIINMRRRIRLPRLLDDHLFNIGDSLTHQLQEYANLLGAVIQNPPETLGYELNTYLVYLIERYQTDHPNVLNSRTKKIRLGTYLNHYIESRKATDNTIDRIEFTELHRDTYTTNLRMCQQFTTEIGEKSLRFYSFVERHLDLFVNPQMRINNRFYFDHRDRP